MKKIIKLVFNIWGYRYKLKLVFYRMLFPHVKWGNNISVSGYPIFRFWGNVSIGKSVTFTSHTKYNFVGINKPCSICVLENASLFIGDYSGFSGVSIFCAKSIIIGKYCNIGGNVFIWDSDFHPLDMEERRTHCQNIGVKPILIEDDVFIGANSIILKGVRIGKGAIIGAGSVVTKCIPEKELWAGNPAKFIKKV